MVSYKANDMQETNVTTDSLSELCAIILFSEDRFHVIEASKTLVTRYKYYISSDNIIIRISYLRDALVKIICELCDKRKDTYINDIYVKMEDISKTYYKKKSKRKSTNAYENIFDEVIVTSLFRMKESDIFSIHFNEGIRNIII